MAGGYEPGEPAAAGPEGGASPGPGADASPGPGADASPGPGADASPGPGADAPLGSAAPAAAGSGALIEAVGVSKTFGDIVAVSDVTFSVGPGVTALLGPNGAGKSTLFRMLCGLTAPTAGTVRVLGADARHDRTVRGRIGLVPQQDALFDRMGALEFVSIAALTEGVVDGPGAARRALGLVQLDPDDKRSLSSYSKGMRQRVKVAAAVVHDPEVLILDEPLAGLDPVQRRRMIELLHGLGAEGRCVLVSSHVLEEVSRLGSRILVIAQGRLVASGDYRDLRELMDNRPHRFQVGVDRPRPFAAALVESGAAVGVSVGPDSVMIDTRDVGRLSCELAPLARRLEARLERVAPIDDDLESVFRYLVERR